MMGCGELESTKNNDYFKMSGFSNPAAKVDVSNIICIDFIQNVITFHLILNFVGGSCQMPIINQTPIRIICQYCYIQLVSSAVIANNYSSVLLNGDSYCNCTILL